MTPGVVIYLFLLGVALTLCGWFFWSNTSIQEDDLGDAWWLDEYGDHETSDAKTATDQKDGATP